MHIEPPLSLAAQACVIPSNDYVRMRWNNRAGWTRQILQAGRPGTDVVQDGPAWDWRLSIAEIELPAVFSSFPGVEREMVLLQGNGLVLRFEEGPQRALQVPHGRCRFRGESGVEGVPVNGVVHVFNLMWRRDAVAAELWHRPLVGPMVVFVDPGSCWAVHLVAGDARISGDAALPPMAGGDTAVLPADGSRARYVVEGGGEALLVRIAPAG
jgi:environmental stress-induced protein Ves